MMNAGTITRLKGITGDRTLVPYITKQQTSDLYHQPFNTVAISTHFTFNVHKRVQYKFHCTVMKVVAGKV
jgi:hypothetical protein